MSIRLNWKYFSNFLTHGQNVLLCQLESDEASYQPVFILQDPSGHFSIYKKLHDLFLKKSDNSRLASIAVNKEDFNSETESDSIDFWIRNNSHFFECAKNKQSEFQVIYTEEFSFNLNDPIESTGILRLVESFNHIIFTFESSASEKIIKFESIEDFYKNNTSKSVEFNSISDLVKDSINRYQEFNRSYF